MLIFRQEEDAVFVLPDFDVYGRSFDMNRSVVYLMSFVVAAAHPVWVYVSDAEQTLQVEALQRRIARIA